jgi:hypothetical protein
VTYRSKGVNAHPGCFWSAGADVCAGFAQKRQIPGGLMKNQRQGRAALLSQSRVALVALPAGRLHNLPDLADVVEPVDTQDLKS